MGNWETEFCQKLINHIDASDIELQPVYIDAFIADHTDEPLLTLLAEVLKLIPDEEERESTMQKVLPALRFGLKTLAKGAVAHLLRQEAADVVDDFDKEISQLTHKAIDASVEAMLKDHIKADESLATLKTVLQELAQTKPIVIFIDELDRCRPDFAISMLEVIKHAFDVEDVRFVLVTNKLQLKSAINHRYGGTDDDAQRYLDKFLKFSFILPSFFKPVHTYHLQQASVAHCQNLIQSSSVLADTALHSNISFALIERIIEVNHLSLREVETLLRHFEIYHLLSGGGFVSNRLTGFIIIQIWGVALFTIQPEVARSVAENHADAAQLGSLWGEDGIPEWSGGHPYPKHYQIFLCTLARESHLSRSLYLPPEETLNNWNELFNRFFDRMPFPPEEGERLTILAETVRTMTLGNPA